jgi:hypothetical protein
MFFCVGYFCGDSADGSVAPAGHNSLFISRNGLTCDHTYILSLGNDNLRTLANRGELCSNLRSRFVRV